MIPGVYMSNENPSNGSVSSTLKEVVILSGDIKMCSKFVEGVILEVTTVNDAKARYFRVVKGRDNGICMFDKRYKY